MREKKETFFFFHGLVDFHSIICKTKCNLAFIVILYVLTGTLCYFSSSDANSRQYAVYGFINEQVSYVDQLLLLFDWILLYIQFIVYDTIRIMPDAKFVLPHVAVVTVLYVTCVQLFIFDKINISMGKITRNRETNQNEKIISKLVKIEKTKSKFQVIRHTSFTDDI